MRRVLLALAFMGLVAGAAQADLSDGVFVAHHPAGLVYTDAPAGGWCGLCDLACIADANNDYLPVVTDPNQKIVWYIVAAFPEATEWCGVEFGIQYNAYTPSIADKGICVPVDGLEIAGTGWPASGTGVSVVTSSMGWTGKMAPVYWFAGFSYYNGVMYLTDNPSTPATTGFADCDQNEFPAAAFGSLGFGVPSGPDPLFPSACCLPGGGCVMTMTEDACMAQGGMWHECLDCVEADCPQPVGACCINFQCSMLEEAACLAAGGVWYADEDCASFECPVPPVGACCINFQCSMLEEAACLNAGGVWYENEDCISFDCPVPSWACCLYDGTCVLTETAADCTAQGGVWHEGLLCAQVTCPVPDVCCVEHLCYFVHEIECTELQGVWHPEFLDCNDNPCEELTPADNTSWGTIKAIYR
jgi:hypothetical protein